MTWYHWVGLLLEFWRFLPNAAWYVEFFFRFPNEQSLWEMGTVVIGGLIMTAVLVFLWPLWLLFKAADRFGWPL